MTETALFRLSRTQFQEAHEFTAVQAAVDGAVVHALEEAANTSTLASLLMGNGASRLARTGILALGANATGRAAWVVQGLGAVGSLGAEVVAFEGTSRALQTLGANGSTLPANPNLWRWGGEGGLRQGFSTSFVTFSALRGAGRAAQGQNIVFQHTAQSLAMVGGHNIAGAFHLIPPPEGSLSEQLFHAEITNIELAAGMGALHTVAPGIHAFERSLDVANQSRGRIRRDGPVRNEGDSFGLQAAAAGERSFPTRFFSEQRGGEKGEGVYAMTTSGGRGQSPSSSPETPHVIREVIERGQEAEIVALKQIVLQMLARPEFHSYTLSAERLQSSERRKWELGLTTVLRDVRAHRALEEISAFREFVRDWSERPHFKRPDEITLLMAPDVKREGALRRELALMQEALVANPSVLGLKEFLLNSHASPAADESSQPVYTNRKTGNDAIHLRLIEEPGRGTVFVGNFKHGGVRIQFDAQGFLKVPIQISNPLSPQSIQAFQTYSPPAPAPRRARNPGNAVAPEPGDRPSQYAQRLDELSREKPADFSVQIAAVLHERFLNPATQNFTRSTVGELGNLTRSRGEGEGLLVRDNLFVPGVEQPLTLVSLPTTFLPEAWSETFVQGIARKTARLLSPVGMAVEVGSGTGFVSIAFSKLRGARRIIATDRNPHAVVVGGLNAALNGVLNIEFRQGSGLEAVKERADLILACLPQMPRSKKGRPLTLRELADYSEETGVFEDVFGLSAPASVVAESRRHLTPEGRLWFMMADRPGNQMVEELFTRRGFHPQVALTRRIQQDRGTDFSALPHIEARTGFRFVFQTAEGRIVSATEASKIPREAIFHHLHLVEGTPYRSTFLGALTEVASESRRWGYTEDPGKEDPSLHRRATEWMSREWGASLPPESVFLGPGEQTLLEGILRLSVPRGGRVGWAGERTLEDRRTLSRLEGLNVEEVPTDFQKSVSALEADPFDAVVLRLPRRIISNPEDLARLLETAASRNTRLIFIESFPSQSDGQVRWLGRVLSDHPEVLGSTVILQPLHERFDLHDYPLTAAIIPDGSLRRDLARYADVTYSRSSSLIQRVYDRFLSGREMETSFADEGPLLPIPEILPEGTRSSFAQSLDLPEIFEAGPRTSHTDPIDMSFGESEHRVNMPEVGPAWLSSVSTPTRLGNVDSEARQAVARYIRERSGTLYSSSDIVFGTGVQPLIGAVLRGIGNLHSGRPSEVVLTDPNYGIFYPAVTAAGGELRRVPTSSLDRFLLTADTLSAQRPTPGRQRVVLLNVPSNPAGQYYRPHELEALAEVALKQDAYVLMDEVFYLLNFTRPQNQSLASIVGAQSPLASRIVTFGGLSKEFALGGLRFGFAATPNSVLREAIDQAVIQQPDPLALLTAASVLPRWRELLPPHIEYLTTRALNLESFFSTQGFQVPRVEGGYSLFVNLNPLFCSPHSIDGTLLTRENFPDLLMSHAGIKIKSDRWSGVPGHYRFVFSIDRLDEAVHRLRQFFDRIQ